MASPVALGQTGDMQAIRGFAIDRHEVTVAQFGAYVQATGIITTAEQAGGGSTFEGGWMEAAYTERCTSAPAGFTTGRTYAYPTGESPQGANCLAQGGRIT